MRCLYGATVHILQNHNGRHGTKRRNRETAVDIIPQIPLSEHFNLLSFYKCTVLMTQKVKGCQKRLDNDKTCVLEKHAGLYCGVLMKRIRECLPEKALCRKPSNFRDKLSII